ncbi:MAG TPA: pentapeptide repeat-containing protein [Archangium sp.]|uniref:KGGVGR-motif variant AAA ATPase n=1 Tax=Archangium sp. TaxID=1872627 RepID=UPI002E3479B5|nr:pentapeptide repeat-containing protein [Archangium sp.]HEX5748299.1 pentapeptide repeat-containing protein [Archangium sp.]
MTTHISTFYSFKGGVGRSLLLANVGVSLARSSQKVLLWDLDMEAPGMHYISGLRAQKLPARGFLEWLVDWQQAGSLIPEGHLLESFLSLAYAVPNIPGLFVLPAFGERGNFARLYQQIDWHAFTARNPELGLKLFQRLLDALSAKFQYDHVLLDSRTGITDLGGLLTAVLPHATVLVGNYSAQNTVGLLSVYRALQKAVDDKLSVRTQGALQRILVASPVPLDEDPSSLARRRAVWDGQFELPPDETRVEVPFVARLLFSEELLVETEPDSPVARAYKRVAQQLLDLRKALLRKQESAELESVLYRDLSSNPSSNRPGPRQKEVRGPSFEQRVERLLQLLGYSVSRGETTGLIAQRKSGFQQERYLVACKESRSSLSAAAVADLADSLRAAIEQLPGTKPMLVASAFSEAARDYFRNWPGVALTLSELEGELFDFKPYLTRLRRNYEESTLARAYVDSRFVPRSHEPKSIPVLERGKAWARGKGSRLWVVLGEAGTGKTSFVRRLAYELATAAERDAETPIPLYIPLRELSGALTLEMLLQEHMATAVGWRGDPAVLLHLLSLGRVVLLLDGLDEMGNAAANLSALEDQFRNLVRPTALEPERRRGNRVLLTARTGLFREPRPVGSRSPEVGQPQLTSLGQVALAFGAEVDELAGWNQEQLLRFLTRSFGDERAEQWRMLLSRLEEKAELVMSRPLLVEMLLYAAPDLSAQKGPLSLGSLFQHFTDRWFKTESLRSPDAAMVQPQIFEHIARELRGRPQGRLHLRQLVSLVRESDERLSLAESERLSAELRSSPFLTRTEPAGTYQFSFKSFEEFFFARYLLRAARGRTLTSALDTPPLTAECVSFLVDLSAIEGGRDELQMALRAVLDSPYRSRVSENALRLAYEWSCNTAGQAGSRSQEEMSRIVPPGVRLQGADLRNARLAFAWLEGAHLEGAQLDGADLTGANFRRVVGTGLKARGSVLDGADFAGADLEAADFSGSSAVQRPPLFEKAMLRDVRLRGTAWQMPDLHEAFLKSTDLGLARWSAPRMVEQGPQDASLVPVLQGKIRSIAISPDGSLLVINSGRNPCVVDATSGRPLTTLEGNESAVNWVAISPDGERVAGGCADGKVILWELASGKLLRSTQAHEDEIIEVMFSPDGRMLATASDDGTARLWDAHADTLLRTLDGHGKAVMTVAFSPDGLLLATGSEDAVIIIWEITQGTLIRTLRGHRSSVIWLAFNPRSSQQLASGSEDGTLRIWNVSDGIETTHFDTNQGAVNSMAFNGTYLAAVTARDRLLVWNSETSTVVRNIALQSQEGVVTFLPGSVSGIVFAASGTLSIEHLDGSGVGALRVSIPWVLDTVFMPDGNAVIGCEDGTIWIWDTRTGECRLSVQTGHDDMIGLAVSPDGKRLVTAAIYGAVQMWSLETGEMLGVISNLERLLFLSFSPDGKYLAGVGQYALVWDLTSPRPQVAFALEGHEGLVLGGVFSPDGKWLATFDDESVRLWDGKTGAAVRPMKGFSHEPSCVSFSPDGRWLASAGDNGEIRVWDLQSRGLTHMLKSPDETIFDISFSPDGSRLLTGSSVGSICVWDLRAGALLKRLDAHREELDHVAFSRDGHRAMTTSWDGATRLWDTETWNSLAELVRLPQGWATLAGPYAVVSNGADTDRVSVQSGNRFAPLTLLRDVCVRPEKVRAALAGQPLEPLRLDLSLAESTRTGRN